MSRFRSNFHSSSATADTVSMSFTTPPFRSFLLAVCGSAAQFPPASLPEIALAGRSNVGKDSHTSHTLSLLHSPTLQHDPSSHLTGKLTFLCRKVVTSQCPGCSSCLRTNRRSTSTPRQVQRNSRPNSDHQLLRRVLRPSARARLAPPEPRDFQARGSSRIR